MKIIRQDWYESERGWGISFDGYSIHESREDRDAFCADYNTKHRSADVVPDVYSFHYDEPYEIDLSTLTNKAYLLLKKSDFGIFVSYSAFKTE